MKIKTFSLIGLFTFLIFPSGCAASGGQDPRVRLAMAAEARSSGNHGTTIDAHNHLHGRLGPRSGFSSDYDGAAQAAMRAMSRFGIRKMLIMPPPFPLNHPHCYDVEDLVDVVSTYPDRFAFLGGGGTLNIMIQKAVREGAVSLDLRRRFEKRALELLSKGAIGFGELTAEHLCLGKRHNHQSAPPDHPLFLLLADVAATHDVPIDIHMEAVPERMPLPKNLASPPNPKELTPNIQAFERLLSHNRKARIIWAHVGWDNTGHRTAALTRQLLKKHPNLYMSVKISPRDSVSHTRPIERGIGLKAEWLRVMRAFSDRFVIGSDQFYLSPRMHRRIGPPSVEPTQRFFSLLPADLARKIGLENPRRIFNLGE
jgi:hypothetical protein